MSDLGVNNLRSGGVGLNEVTQTSTQETTQSSTPKSLESLSSDAKEISGTESDPSAEVLESSLESQSEPQVSEDHKVSADLKAQEEAGDLGLDLYLTQNFKDDLKEIAPNFSDSQIEALKESFIADATEHFGDDLAQVDNQKFKAYLTDLISKNEEFFAEINPDGTKVEAQESTSAKEKFSLEDYLKNGLEKDIKAALKGYLDESLEALVTTLKDDLKTYFENHQEVSLDDVSHFVKTKVQEQVKAQVDALYKSRHDENASKINDFIENKVDQVLRDNFKDLDEGQVSAVKVALKEDLSALALKGGKVDDSALTELTKVLTQNYIKAQEEIDFPYIKQIQDPFRSRYQVSEAEFDSLFASQNIKFGPFEKRAAYEILNYEAYDFIVRNGGKVTKEAVAEHLKGLVGQIDKGFIELYNQNDQHPAHNLAIRQNLTDGLDKIKESPSHHGSKVAGYLNLLQGMYDEKRLSTLEFKHYFEDAIKLINKENLKEFLQSLPLDKTIGVYETGDPLEVEINGKKEQVIPQKFIGLAFRADHASFSEIEAKNGISAEPSGRAEPARRESLMGLGIVNAKGDRVAMGSNAGEGVMCYKTLNEALEHHPNLEHIYLVNTQGLDAYDYEHTLAPFASKDESIAHNAKGRVNLASIDHAHILGEVPKPQEEEVPLNLNDLFEGA